MKVHNVNLSGFNFKVKTQLEAHSWDSLQVTDDIDGIYTFKILWHMRPIAQSLRSIVVEIGHTR